MTTERPEDRLLEAIFGKPNPEELPFYQAKKQVQELAETTLKVFDLRMSLFRFISAHRDLLPEGKALTKARMGYLQDLDTPEIQRAVEDIWAERFSGRQK